MREGSYRTKYLLMQLNDVYIATTASEGAQKTCGTHTPSTHRECEHMQGENEDKGWGSQRCTWSSCQHAASACWLAALRCPGMLLAHWLQCQSPAGIQLQV